MLFPALGAPVTAELRERYQRSPQWRDGVFVNTVPTELSIRARDLPRLLMSMLRTIPEREPTSPLPWVAVDAVL